MRMPNSVSATLRRIPTSAALMEQASEAAGLTDFGPGDFREGLDRLLESLELDADLADSAIEHVVGPLRERLRNRLQVEAWYKDHPEIEGLTIRGPVDVNGLPRSGTTALINMMSLDPQFRCLRGWEQAQPCPPPILADEEQDARRLAAIENNKRIPAELKAMHLYDADAAMEDTDLLGMAFHGQQGHFPVWRYHTWWRSQADMSDTYQYHRRVVTLLQSRRPPNLWLFKSPHHNFHLEAIAAAYPDAKFIMNHRDPAKAIPSWVSLTSTLHPPAAGERDLKRVGRELCEHLRVGVENGMSARQRIGEDRFLDVHHRDLLADPFGAIARVYDFLGLELTPSFQASLERWHKENHAGAHGKHHYTAEQFGLSKAQIRKDYQKYIERFDVQIED
jgi:hypothetical protein